MCSCFAPLLGLYFLNDYAELARSQSGPFIKPTKLGDQRIIYEASWRTTIGWEKERFTGFWEQILTIQSTSSTDHSSKWSAAEVKIRHERWILRTGWMMWSFLLRRSFIKSGEEKICVQEKLPPLLIVENVRKKCFESELPQLPLSPSFMNEMVEIISNIICYPTVTSNNNTLWFIVLLLTWPTSISSPRHIPTTIIIAQHIAGCCPFNRPCGL